MRFLDLLYLPQHLFRVIHFTKINQKELRNKIINYFQDMKSRGSITKIILS
ncbi:hypothetical protein SAMN05444355_10683 [Flavobacterium frigoris]|uniref:Uncharacterized protein n=1 Tax=Flavobacterium frigoris TaxID=229204 RepID=A0A1H9KSC9_FLAFI|nr:hypothetical protein SAMN05444355_10683 [Flavobacterium frigoris]